MKNKKKSPTETAEEIINLQNAKNDPQGSYTGVPLNPFEKPVQDADDL